MQSREIENEPEVKQTEAVALMNMLRELDARIDMSDQFPKNFNKLMAFTVAFISGTQIIFNAKDTDPNANSIFNLIINGLSIFTPVTLGALSWRLEIIRDNALKYRDETDQTIQILLRP